jgi:hypothetical protein
MGVSSARLRPYQLPVLDAVLLVGLVAQALLLALEPHDLRIAREG